MFYCNDAKAITAKGKVAGKKKEKKKKKESNFMSSFFSITGNALFWKENGLDFKFLKCDFSPFLFLFCIKGKLL